MRSSEDDACCDILTASPEARGRCKSCACFFHGKDRRAEYREVEVELGVVKLLA